MRSMRDGARVIEFEVKARVEPGREAPLRALLGAPTTVEEHVDAYFQHPCRDFRASDEAVRVSVRGARVEVTYKGPRLEAGTKSRREVSLPTAHAGDARAFLIALGFAPVVEVRKRREVFHAAGFEVGLDTVPGLGVFVEVERLVEEGADLGPVRAEAEALLASWGLDHARERRSYLELLTG